MSLWLMDVSINIKLDLWATITANKASEAASFVDQDIKQIWANTA